MPTSGQFALLFAAVALFFTGGLLSFARLWRPSTAIRLTAKSCLYWGILAAVAVLVWHGFMRGRWVPIGDNFDALIWLGVLLALFIAYVQRARPLAALDWFVMPIVILLLLAAALFGRAESQPYVRGAWLSVHYITNFAGAAAFAIAAASGAMYVISSARLRRKQPVGAYLGSLERMERLTMTAVTLGFALLTIGIITGLVEHFAQGKSTSMAKVALAGSVWVVYAVVMHAPINPIFRGRRAAVLSIVGFMLMIGATVAAILPAGGR